MGSSQDHRSARSREAERRAYPRVHMDRTVDVWLLGQQRVRVTLHDLSPDAVQIRCDLRSAIALHPAEGGVAEGRTPEVYLALNLPSTGKRPLEVVVRCRMRYFALLEDEEVAFGLGFQAPGESVELAVEQFIRQTGGATNWARAMGIWRATAWQPAGPPRWPAREPASEE